MRTEALEVLDTDARIPYVRPPRRVPLQLLARRRQPARAVAAHHAGQLPHRCPRVGRADRRRRTGPSRRRELGVGRRRRHRTGVHARPGRAVPGRLRRLRRARIRHGDTRIRRRRIRAAGGQVAARLGGHRHRAGGHGLRRRLADRLGLPAGDQAVAPGHPAGRGGDRVRGRPHRRPRRPPRWTAPRASSAPCWDGPSTSGTKRSTNCGVTGADPDRRAHRRELVDTPRVAADRAAHRLVLRRSELSRRFAAGGRVRRIPWRAQPN